MGKQLKKNIGARVTHSGVSFRVWAPFATSVAVTGTFNNWSEAPLNSEGDGYWAGDIEAAEAGQEYKYVIRNGDQVLHRNDARAQALTTTAGNSVIVSPDFDWGEVTYSPPPINQQIIYELHVGTFNRADPAVSGTFADVEAKLDYLKELGINMIELMPISNMMMDRGWGYAIDYIYSVESLYGGRHGFMKFVKSAHERGIGVILDVVYNHFGPDKNMDLWQYDGWSENGKGGIYFYNDWRSQTPWGDTRPDYGRPEVRQYILDNVRMWLSEFKLDGLRVDSTIFLRNVYGHNDDPSTDLADGWSLLQQVSSLARKINRPSLVVAEDIGWNDYLTKPKDQGGAGFSTQWEVTLPHAIRQILNPINDSDRNLALLSDAIYHRYNNNAFERVVYSDSHDSASNGAARLSEEISPGNPSSIYARKRCLLAAAVILTCPGIPMMLEGQEFLQGGSFNDWQALEWAKADQFEGIVLAHRHLINLRKNSYSQTAGLTGQSVNVIHRNDQAKVLAYHRWDRGGPGDDVVVVINFSNKTFNSYSINLPGSGWWQVRFNSTWSGYSPDFKEEPFEAIEAQNGTANLRLPPYSALILSQDG